MTKPFLTYQQQLHKLIIDKQLIIKNLDFARQKLCDIGYFSLIDGYKNPFLNPMTRIYLPNTTFEDIFALYHFDNLLRELIFRYLCSIEKKMRSLISYAFCARHGELQQEYLSPSNYNYTPKNRQGIHTLIRILERLANSNTDYEYLVYQRKVYNNVPFWILVNALTFGQLSKIYSFLPFQIQSSISRNFIHVNEKALEQYLRSFVLYRNVCAHNERLFSHKIYSDIPDTPLHIKLKIPQSGAQFLMGKRDLFSIVIAFRYLLSKSDFEIFKRELSKLIDKYLKSSSRICEQQLLHLMGFPLNWKDISKYKL